MNVEILLLFSFKGAAYILGKRKKSNCIKQGRIKTQEGPGANFFGEPLL